MAMLYDLLLVVAVIGAVAALALLIQVRVLGSASHALHPLFTRGLVVCSLYAFFMLFWLRSGQTLGMQAWRIKLVGFDGHRPRLGQALLRCLGATLSATCLGLGYLWCLVDRRRRYWHDYLSGTELVLLPAAGRKRRDAH